MEAGEQAGEVAVVVAHAIPAVHGVFDDAQPPSHERCADGDSEGRRADADQRVPVAQPHVAGDPGEQLPRLAGHVDAAADPPAVVGEHGDGQGNDDSDHRPARPATAGGDEVGAFAAKGADEPGAPRSRQVGDRAGQRDQRQLDADDDQRRGGVARRELIDDAERSEDGHGLNVPGRGRGLGKPRRTDSLVLHGDGRRQGGPCERCRRADHG